jgi:hypothetical protein
MVTSFDMLGLLEFGAFCLAFQGVFHKRQSSAGGGWKKSKRKVQNRVDTPRRHL